MKFKRLIIGSFLIVILFLVCSNYASNEEYYINSNTTELFFNYPGSYIFASGMVTNIYNDGFEFSVNKNGNITIYHVKTRSKVKLDDTAYILGTLNSSNVITSLKLITVKKSDFDFVIIRSIFGMFLFLIIFGKYWKFNPQKMVFTRRR